MEENIRIERLEEMKVLQVCAYAAPYEGNFMNSLFTLQERLNCCNHKMVYAFPDSAADISWCKSLSMREKVYFLPLEKARIKPSTYQKLKKIFSENPDIQVVHSHFELYDLPLALITPKNVKLFWHRHDAIIRASFSREILKTLQYRFCSKRAYLLSASEKCRIQLVKQGFPALKSKTIINGINLQRIQDATCGSKKNFDFLAFVWLYHCKGADIILDACEMLLNEGYQFKVLLLGSQEAKDEVSSRFPNGTKSIVFGEPQEDINILYRDCKVFISASRQETFSYSVCEAAYAGLPVISSKIEGLEWAEELPTVSFFESENVQALFTSMKAYLDGKIVSNVDIEKTRSIINKKYSAEHWAEMVIDAYGLS